MAFVAFTKYRDNFEEMNRSGALVACCNQNLSMIATPAPTSAPAEREESFNSIRKSLLPENKELSIGLHDTSRRSGSRRSGSGKVGGGICSTDMAKHSLCCTRLSEFKSSTNHSDKESLDQNLALKLPLNVSSSPAGATGTRQSTPGRTRTRQLEIQSSDVSDSTVMKHSTRRSWTLGVEIDGHTRLVQQSSTDSNDDEFLTEFVDRISKRSGPNSKTKSQQSSMATSPLRRPRATRSSSMRAISSASESDGAFFRARSPTNQLLHQSDGSLDLQADSTVSLRRAVASSSGTRNDGAPGRRSPRNELSQHSDGSIDPGTECKASLRRAMSSLSERKTSGALHGGRSPNKDLLYHCDEFQNLIADRNVSSSTSQYNLDFSKDDLCHSSNINVTRKKSDSNRLHQPMQETPLRPARFTRSVSMREVSSLSEAANGVALLREQSLNNELRHQSNGFLNLLGEERTVAFGAAHSRSIATSRRPPARRSSLPIPIKYTTSRDGLFDARKNRIQFFALSEGCKSVVGREADQHPKDSAHDGQVEIGASLVGLARLWSITDPDDEKSQKVSR